MRYENIDISKYSIAPGGDIVYISDSGSRVHNSIEVKVYDFFADEKILDDFRTFCLYRKNIGYGTNTAIADAGLDVRTVYQFIKIYKLRHEAGVKQLDDNAEKIFYVLLEIINTIPIRLKSDILEMLKIEALEKKDLRAAKLLLEDLNRVIDTSHNITMNTTNNIDLNQETNEILKKQLNQLSDFMNSVIKKE